MRYFFFLLAFLGFAPEAMATRLIFEAGPTLLPTSGEACFRSNTLTGISELADVFSPAEYGCEDIGDLRDSVMCEAIAYFPDAPEQRVVMMGDPPSDIIPLEREMCWRTSFETEPAVACANMAEVFGHFVCPAPAGTIEVSLSPETPRGAVIPMETMQHVASFSMEAIDEDFEISQVGVIIEPRGHTVDAAPMIESVRLCLRDECVDTVPIGDQAVASFATPVTIPVTEEHDVRVEVQIAESEHRGGTAESQSQFSVTFHGDSLVARGMASDELAVDVPDVMSDETFVVMESSFTHEKSAISPTGGITPRPDQKVICVNVTAHASEGVRLNHIPIAFFATDNAVTPSYWENCNDGLGLTGDSFRFTVDDEEADANFTLRNASGDICDPTAAFGDGEDVGSIVIDPIGGLALSAGVTKTYCVHMDTTEMGPDSLQMSVLNDLTELHHGIISAGHLAEDDLSPFDRLITVSTPWLYAEGDILCMDTSNDGCDAWDERMLVTSVDGDELNVIRGYGGTSPDQDDRNDLDDDIDVVGRALLWTGTSDPLAGPDQYFGGYTLPLVDGNVLVNE